MTRALGSDGLAFARDARGAIMVLGLVMAVFLVAALYAVVGITEAITQRETMQDAADAAAFSAAVLHARGMNAIALINILMAALLAILVALKLLEAVLGIAIVLLAAAAFFTGGATASAIPEVEAIRRDVRATHDTLRAGIFPALEALHVTARGVRAVVPWTAQLRVMQVARENGPHAFAAFAVPARVALPTEDGKYAQLCEEAGDYVGKSAALAVPPFLPGSVRRAVGNAIGDLASARADWFCGAKGGRAPSTSITETRVIPVLKARDACESYSPGADGYDEDEHAARCDKAARAEKRWEPNHAGDCSTAECRERAERARIECKPDPDKDLSNWMYQERRVQRKWGYRPSRKVPWGLITEEVIEGPVLVRPNGGRTHKRPPCGTEDAAVAPDWNEAMHEEHHPDRPLPLCAEAPEFPHVPPSKSSGFHEQLIREVTHVYGCTEVRRKRISADEVTKGDRLDPAGAGESKAPQIAWDDDLGGEGYQIRAVALGTLPRGAPARTVKMAAWGEKSGGVLHEVARRFSGTSFAQAEYYYAVEHPKRPDPARWLWNMNWTARLRRVRPPEKPTHAGEADPADAERWGIGTLAGDLGDACRKTHDGTGDAQPECATVEDRLREIQDLVVH